jgi:predicted nucleotidyltransferase
MTLTGRQAHGPVSDVYSLWSVQEALRAAIGEVTKTGVRAVLPFGSIPRGEAAAESDIELAVIARPTWEKRVELQDIVRTRLGDDCDVLVSTEAEFSRLAAAGEPVVNDIAPRASSRRPRSISPPPRTTLAETERRSASPLPSGRLQSQL